MNAQSLLLESPLALLSHMGAFVLLLVLALAVFILASLVLEYHWRTYGHDITAVTFLRKVYFFGSIPMLLMLIISFIAI
ncbi:MAG TPA: hypothetical protein PLF31_03605 [Candidatus Paceibacterota bacterium]|nr:hypothetical protein [Candidatus Paceibacterota bacterium]